MFSTYIKRLSIDIFCFLSLATLIAFLFLQIEPFVGNLIRQDCINVRSISYIIYCFLLTVFSFSLLSAGIVIDKVRLLRYVCYAIAVVILIGTLADLIVYRFFTYSLPGINLVFGDIMWNIKGWFGAVLSIITSILYIMLGRQIKRTRRRTYVIYLILLLITSITPFVYSLIVNGYMPFTSWLQHRTFIIASQLFLLVSLSVAVTSRTLWNNHIWH